ncbi:MAG: HD domain-containing phosphohydrolase [Eubacteriales bacterium]|nr:HD domain-containing phosphohydrolase [Eubacteriales bacterium]
MQLAAINMVQENAEKTRGILMRMTDLLECWELGLGQHSRRTAAYVELLVEKMREMGVYGDVLTPECAERLKRGACMHEIGRLASVPAMAGIDTVSGNNCAQAGERLMGRNLEYLSDDRLARIIQEMISCQQEKWDGTGFPRGLKGEEIPLSARILAVADMYDCLLEQNPGEKEAASGKAADAMKKECGQRFDPEILNAFLACV